MLRLGSQRAAACECWACAGHVGGSHGAKCTGVVPGGHMHGCDRCFLICFIAATKEVLEEVSLGYHVLRANAEPCAIRIHQLQCHISVRSTWIMHDHNPSLTTRPASQGLHYRTCITRPASQGLHHRAPRVQGAPCWSEAQQSGQSGTSKSIRCV